MAWGACGCDQGTQRDELPGMGGQPLVPVSLVSQNVGPGQTLPVNGRIELGFDRLLLPASITRQTFVLENAGGTTPYTPTIAYDPVTRIVSITPLANDPMQPFVVGQSYAVIIVAPTGPTDGLRAIDLATLKGGQQKIEFTVSAATAAPAPIVIDYCRDINPIFESVCSLSQCHGGTAPAAGLQLVPSTGIPLTAVGRVSQGSNTGPRSAASPPTLLFSEDMPIIDSNGSTGDPGHSWMMYKLLLANPSPEPFDAGAGEAGEEDAAGPQGIADATVEAGAMDAGAGAPEGGASDGGGSEGGVSEAGTAEGGAPVPVVIPPVDVSGAYAPLALQAPSAAERAVLSNYILGRQMPFPAPGALASTYAPLTLSQLERVSLWISQGAVSAASCP